MARRPSTLQARMFAQQGLRLDAEACWRKAGALDGSPRAYEAALVRLRRPPRALGLIPTLLLIAGLAAIGWQLTSLLQQPKVASEVQALLRGEIAAASTASASMVSSLQGLEKALRDIEARLTERIGPLPAAVASLD